MNELCELRWRSGQLADGPKRHRHHYSSKYIQNYNGVQSLVYDWVAISKPEIIMRISEVIPWSQ
jgi:hypothetical protein